MKPVTTDVADAVRRFLLRAFAAPPGVRIEQVGRRRVLIAIATSHVRCRVDGVPVAQVAPEMFVDDGERPIRHRVGGTFIAAILAVDGTVVRSGRQHYLIAHGELVPIDRRAYQYLLRLRTTRSVAKVIDAAADPTTRRRIAQVGPKPNAPGGAA